MRVNKLVYVLLYFWTGITRPESFVQVFRSDIFGMSDICMCYCFEKITQRGRSTFGDTIVEDKIRLRSGLNRTAPYACRNLHCHTNHSC